MAIGRPFCVSLTLTNRSPYDVAELAISFAARPSAAGLPPAVICLTERARLGRLGRGQVRSLPSQPQTL